MFCLSISRQRISYRWSLISARSSHRCRMFVLSPNEVAILWLWHMVLLALASPEAIYLSWDHGNTKSSTCRLREFIEQLNQCKTSIFKIVSLLIRIDIDVIKILKSFRFIFHLDDALTSNHLVCSYWTLQNIVNYDPDVPHEPDMMETHNPIYEMTQNKR